MYSQRNFYKILLPGLLLSAWSYGVNTLFNLLLENASRQCCRSTSVKCCVCYPAFPGHSCSLPEYIPSLPSHEFALCTSVRTVIMGVLSGNSCEFGEATHRLGAHCPPWVVLGPAQLSRGQRSPCPVSAWTVWLGCLHQVTQVFWLFRVTSPCHYR